VLEASVACVKRS